MREMRYCKGCKKYKYADTGVAFEYENKPRWYCGVCVQRILKGPPKPAIKRKSLRSLDKFVTYIERKENEL